MKADGIIEFTEEGYPVVAGEYSCLCWEAGSGGTFEMRECWYCKYADFRKTTQMMQKIICRCPSFLLPPGLQGQKQK